MSTGTTNGLPWPVTVEQSTGLETAEVSTDRATLELAVADTEAERNRGLGERDTLPKSGMLFVIDPPVPTEIWMKGMRFPLDVVWLRNGRIVFVQEYMPVADPSDPTPPTYGPDQPVDAIIEVAAGSAKGDGFGVGQTVRLDGLY